MVQIASVDIGTKLDLSGFYRGLETLSSAKTPVIKVDIKYDAVGIEREKKQLEKLLTQRTTIRIKADHSGLYELNRHIESKRTHVKELNLWMSQNPIRVKVDNSELKAAKVKERITSTSTAKKGTTEYKLKDTISDYSDIVDSIENLNKTVSDGFKAQKKGIFSEIKTGFLENVGKGLNKTATEIFSKITKNVTDVGKSYLGNITSSKKTKATQESKTYSTKEKEEQIQSEELKRQMLAMNRKQVLEPLAQKVGIKNARNLQGGKQKLVDELISKVAFSDLKSRLPYVDNISQIAAQEGAKAIKQQSSVLIAGIQQSIKEYTSEFKQLKGTGSQPDIANLSNEIEGKYKEIIGILNSGLETDVRKALEGAKLQLAKIRKAVGKEHADIATQVLSQEKQKGVTQSQFLRRGQSFTPLQKRRLEQIEYNKRLVDERADQLYKTLPDLPENTKRIALVSGGFAGKMGKSSKGIAQRMQPFLGDDTFVQPVENFDTDDDIDYDQPGLKKIKWFKHVGKIFLRHNLQKGYKEDALEAAAYAQALQKKAKSQGLEIPHIEGYGYSSGGYLMQEVAELSRGKIPFKGVGIGTPHYNVSNTASPDDYLSILGDQDPLWTLQGKKESPNLKRYQNAGKKHILEKYLTNASVQKDIYQHMGRDLPFVLGNQFEDSIMAVMATANEYLTLNPKMRPVFKDSGSIDAVLEEIAEHRQTITDQINNIPEDILEDVLAADEILLGFQNQLMRSFDIETLKIEPLAKRTFSNAQVTQENIQLPNPPISSKETETVKKAINKKNVKLPDVKTNNSLSAYYGLSALQAKQLDTNYKNTFKEVANISGFEIAGRELPGLHVDEKLLKEQSADALYDIQNNQIIISKELQKALSQTPQALSQYADQFQALVHEARHALQFDLGTLTMADLELGLKPGAKLKPFSATSAFAQQSARESLQYAKITNPLMTPKQDSVLATVEADAFDFESNTQDIIENLIATDTFENAFGNLKQEKLAFKKAIEDIEKLLGEGLNHLAKILTDFGKGLITKVQTSLTGFLTGNRTRKETGTGGYSFQYVRRGKRIVPKVINEQPDIPDPWFDNEGEYRRASVVPGTGGYQFAKNDPRASTAKIKNQVKKRFIKPLVRNLEFLQDKTEEGIEDFNNRLESRVQSNTQRILQEVARMSNVTFKEGDIPKIVVNNSIAKTYNNQAIYDVQKNQIVITRRIKELLQANPKVLEQFNQELKPIVAAAKHKIDTSATSKEIEEFSNRTGEVFARVATTARGKRSNYPVAVKAISEGLEDLVDTLAVGKQEFQKLKRKVSLYTNHLRQAAKTPDNMEKPIKADDYTKLGIGTKTKDGAIARAMNLKPILENNNTLSRLYRAAIPKSFREQISRIGNNNLAEISVNPIEKLDKAVNQIQKYFKKPIDLYAKFNIKGLADALQEAQGIVNSGLDKLQTKTSNLPYFGDLASKAVGGLKLFTQAGVSGVLVGLRFLNVLAKFTQLQTLAAQVALVTLQFNSLKKVFISVANEGNRSAEAFERITQNASTLRIDKTLAATGASSIFGNIAPKMGGQFAEQVNTRAQELVAIFAKDAQQAQQIFDAFDNLTQNSILSMQDFRSISNAIPGSLDTMARSMGMTSAEFEVFVSNNQILTEDLLPRLMQQLEVENQPKLQGHLETLTAATNRYNNAMLDMQLAVGDVLAPLEKFRLNIVASSLETVGKKVAEISAKWSASMAILGLTKLGIAFKNLLATIIPIVTRIPVFQTGMVALVTVFKAVLPIVGKLALEFVLFQLAIDTISAVFKTFQSAGGQFKTWADQSAANAEKVALAFDKAATSAKNMAKALPTNEKDLKQTNSRFEDTLVGAVFGKENVRWAESKLDKFLAHIPKYKTYAQKELYDKEEAVQQQVINSGKNSQRVLELRGGQDATLKDFVKIEQELETIKAKRRSLITLNPSNTVQLRELRLQERALLKERDIKAVPITHLQSAIASDIKGIEDALAKIDDEAQKGAWTQESYSRATDTLKMGLLEAEKSQAWLNKQIKDGTTALIALKHGFAKLNTELADTNTNLQTNYNQKLIAINKAVAAQTMTSGESQFAQMNNELELIASQLSTNKTLALEMREALDAKGGEETLDNWGVDYKKTGTEEFALLASRAEEKGNPKEQEVFTQYKRIKELENETVNIELQLSQRKADYSKQLTDLNKQITEYYISATRQFAESSLEAQRQTSNLKTQTYATNIRTSISGFQDNIVSQFAESVISSIEQLSEAADKQFDVESAALQANNAFEDSLKQGEELRKQLPGINTNGTIDIPAIPIELDLSKLGIDNSFIDITRAFNESLSSAKDTIEDSADSTNNLTEAFQSVTSGSIDFGDSVQQAVDNTDSGTIATQNLATELLNTTFTASDLGFAIDTNTDSLNANNDAVIATNDSLFGSIDATGIVTASTVNWGTETSNVHNVIESGLKVALNSLPVCLQDIIKNTVDWFSTFANNIPILNSIGQIFNSWGQQLSNVSQSIVGFGQGAMQNIDNVMQKGVGFVQNALGIGGDKPPVGNANQPVFPIAGVTYDQAQSKKSSDWGMRRHPVTGQIKMHRGQDFGYGEGTQVVSPMAGIVTGVKYQEGGAGKYVVVESIDEQGRKIEHKFFHLSAYDVVEGQKVNAGDKIGKVGSTGIGTGAHLHYETWINGKNVNPTEFLAGRNGRGINSAQKGMLEQHYPGDGHNHGEVNKGKPNQNSTTPTRISTNVGSAPKLGTGYEALNELGGQLTQNKYFNPSTAEGRGRLALALGIGGSEAFEKNTKRRAFYTYKGGAGNNMQGFGQFNNAYYSDIINTPEKYQNFFGQILAGERHLPNKKGIGNYGAKVTEAVRSGQIKSGQDLIKWMQANKLGGSNWQGVDDGWKRNPGLADQLVQYLKGELPTQVNSTAANTNNISAPQQIPQIANTPIPTVWTPGSVNTRGNAVINEVTGRAEQQRNRQIELARQKASNEAAQNTATALRNSNKAFLELERGLRENGIKVNSLGNQVTDTNLEYQGALDNEQKRQQEQRKLEEKYSELENNLVEQSRTIQSQVDTAKTLLSKGGIVSPEMRERVQKLIDDPNIKDNLKEQLRTALTTGVLGDDGRNILTRAVSEGEDQLKKLETGLSSVRSGRAESKKLLDERFAREEAVRKQQAGFDIESASLETLKAKLELLQTLKEKTPFAPEVQGIPALEQVIKSREEQLNLEKQLKEIADKERDKVYTKDEADKLRAEVQARKKIVDATIAQKTEQAKIILQREQENRDREAANELAQSELASDKAKVEQLKLLQQTNPLSPELQNNAIGDLEQRIALREAELQLVQDLAAIEQLGIEGKRTPDEVNKLKAGKQEEHQKKVENIKTQGEQTAFASQIAQEKTILSIKQQQLDYQKQVSDVTTQAINLGLQQGDPLKLKFEIDKSELAVNVEKQILDMKEFARSTGKSQDEVAALEQQIRGLNAVSLGNLEAEFNKAVTARATAIGQKVTESRVELLDSKASFYSNRGMTNEARRLQRESAILQQQNSYRNQKNDLEEFIKTNQVGAAEAANLRDNLEQVNQVKFDSIKDNFNAFKPVIDSAQSGLKNFFTGIIKGGQSIDDLFKGLMDSILSSVAELASNFLVEKLFGGFLGKGKNEGQWGMFSKGNSEEASPLSPIGNILGDATDLGTSPITPMFVNVVNGNTIGGLGSGSGLTSILGDKEDSSNSLIPSLFSGFTDKVDSANPVPVGIIKSNPDALSPITNVLGNVFSGKGGLGSIVSSIGSLFSGGSKGGSGLGSILGSAGGMFGGGGLGGILGIASSLLGSFFWEGGIVGNYAHGGIAGIAEAIGRERDMNGGRAVAIAALTHGERVLNLSQTANLEKLGGIDILNFSDGGTVGYVPTKTEYGGSADKVTESKSQSREVNVKLETQVINGVEYLTKSQGEELARKAAEQGAMQGARYVSDKLINSPSYRSTHGI